MLRPHLLRDESPAPPPCDRVEHPPRAMLTMVTVTGCTIEEPIPFALVPQEQALCAELLAAGVVGRAW